MTVPVSRVPIILAATMLFLIFTTPVYGQVPRNAHVLRDRWYCDNGFRRVADHCEAVHAPANAHVIRDQWYCDNGFKKVTDRCEAVQLPANAHVVRDQWYCDNGFKRVGNECISLMS